MPSAMLTFTNQSRQIANDTVVSVSVDAYVYGPSTPGDYPVIVYSHGTFGFADQSNPNFTTSLPLYWASQGYIVIVPGHADGQDATASQNSLGLPNFDDSVGATDGFLWNRVQDMRMAVDHAADLAAALGEGYGVTDYIVSAGYSAGGGAAQVAAGASIKDLTGAVVNWGDSRFDAVIDLSAGGVPIYGFYDDASGNSWQSLDKPLFVAAGEEDTQKGGANYQYKLDPYDNAPAGDKYGFVFNDANHGDFGVQAANNPNVYDELAILTTKFLNGYAKGNAADLAYLKNVDAQMADNTTFTELWQALHSSATAGTSATGTSGANAMTGTDNNDTLDGAGSGDTLTGGMGNDSLDGGAGSDSVLGGSGKDTLVGGLGTDTLTGGFDIDTLTGGAGADNFRFTARGDGGGEGDTITDFAVGSDKIDVDALLTSIGQSTTTLGAYIDVKVVGSDTWILLDVNNDTSGTSNIWDDEVIAIVKNVTTLGASDFLF